MYELIITVVSMHEWDIEQAGKGVITLIIMWLFNSLVNQLIWVADLVID